MKTISIRELHEKTGEWIRLAGEHGEIRVTDRRKTVAKILPEEAEEEKTPYFSRRVFSAAFRKLMEQGALGRGADSTQIVSEDRDRQAS